MEVVISYGLPTPQALLMPVCPHSPMDVSVPQRLFAVAAGYVLFHGDHLLLK